MPRPKSKTETDNIRRMIEARLQRRELDEAAPVSSTGSHLDEDALSAFVEARLRESEAAPLIKHLVACGSCRRITAQLIRLDQELSELEEPARRTATEEEPGRFRRFLDELAARVLPSSDEDAVFAYHAPAEDFQKATEGETGREREPSAMKDEPETPSQD